MATEMRSLLIEQNATVDALKRVLVNFKKLAKANVTLPRVQSRLSSLDSLWRTCSALHVKLLQTATSEEKKTLSYFQKEEFLEAEDAYHDAADTLHETISRLSHSSLPADYNRSTDSSIRDSNSHCFQLPRIAIPKFSGKLTEWEGFRNTFESLVASNDTLSNTQKFHYLKTSVQGDAALIINNFRISDSNYESAWRLLIDEFDDKHSLIHAHLHAFACLPPMKTENVTELKRLRDTVSASLAALNNLGRPVDQWDDLIIYIVMQKFSARTRSEWSLKRSALSELPTYKDFNEFLTLRIRGLSDSTDSTKESGRFKVDKPRSFVNNISVAKCIACSGSHLVSKCEDFLRQSVAQRSALVRQHKICYNCLRSGHIAPKCPSKYRCVRCRRSHHTLLHADYGETSEPRENAAALKASQQIVVPNESHDTSAHSSASVATVQTVQPPCESTPTVLLATAWVDLHTAEGRSVKVRALLDQGSTFSFISESLCQTLRTKRRRTNLQIRCFGDKSTGIAKSRVTLRLTPCSRPSPVFPLTAYIYQLITSYSAAQIRPVESWPHLKGLSLADPDPSSRHSIHLLIGADVYGSLLRQDLRQGPPGAPTAQLTALGWIISGPNGDSHSSSDQASVLTCVLAPDTDKLLRKFWEDESIVQVPTLSEEEVRCENHFVNTHGRSKEGRYIVRLPFKETPRVDIGESLSIAELLYKKQEKRLLLRPEMCVQYREFLREYVSLGHMSRVDWRENSAVIPVYIPHHPVMRESSCTTKLRVVFNASCKTRNGTSLNDHLMIGPKLQQDLSAILLRWRQWCFVYTADIAKMFRQILVHPLDTDYQRILWRRSGDSPFEHYRLLTVTYGLAPAPYLALRVLKQLALDEGSNHPAAVSVLNEAVYVDDVLFGADSSETLVETRSQLVELLKKGGFQLRKWACNSRDLLDDLPSNQSDQPDHLLLKDDILKILGLSWLPNEDSFRFVVNVSNSQGSTKRSILSLIARLYDPLGWAAPVVINAKIMLQELWLHNYDWDELIPTPLSSRWEDFQAKLSCLNDIRIPRWTGQRRDNSVMEIHGFADASTRAYAAAVYLRVLHSLSHFQITLLVAKTKVAPLKTVSVPRLELNAVLLLSRLIKWTIESMNFPQIPIYGWTDSSVALAWLQQHPSRWTPYVANRVSEVQGHPNSVRWNHVPSRDNPADCASRGLCASELKLHSLWWTGPPWLKRPSTCWPTRSCTASLLPDLASQIRLEERKSVALHVSVPLEWDMLSGFSSWTRLMRVTAYMRRFLRCLKSRKTAYPHPSLSLSIEELRQSEVFWLQYAQKQTFHQEIPAILKQSPVSNASPLKGLLPFMGEDSLLRIGGRLKNSALGYDERHPIILPKHRVSELLIDKTHKATLHGGVQLVLRTLRQKYWILSARGSVKKHIRLCVTCVRYAAKPIGQLMGDLPSSRVTPAPPFKHAGVDYAGPFKVTSFVGRGQKAHKVYVALFVCFATRAIHLECVEDYSTAGFLAAFKRFASRRGLPRCMYSDNGTNFCGADRELQRHFNSLVKEPFLGDALANDGTDWRFIPSLAPHFGGLWEAGVKSFKSHLRRVAGPRTLSQSEFSTLLCQIEACLNSRPIAALSDDPNDMSALTPGHFLVGRPLVSAPEESVLPVNPNRLSRWQLVRAMQEQFWRAWSHDYLHTLQQRRKWDRVSSNIKIGELVLVKNPLLPPSKWELARVQLVHPGADGLVRVVTIRTSHALLKRPITQLCRLPISGDSDDCTSDFKHV